MVFPFGVMRDGKQTPVFSVLFMMLAGVFHLLFGRAGPFLLPLIGGWCCLAAGWFFWVRHRPYHDCRVFLLVLGLGSPLLFYSLTLWEHSLAMAAVALSFALVSQPADGIEGKKRWEPILAGFLIAVAAAFRTEALALAVIILPFWRYTERDLFDWRRYLFGLMAGVALFGLVNCWQTGQFLPLHLSSNLEASRILSIKAMAYLRLENLYTLILQGLPDWSWSVILLVPIMLVVFGRSWRYQKTLSYPMAALVLGVWIYYIHISFSAANRAFYTVNSGGMLWVVPLVSLSLLPFRDRLRPHFWWLLWGTSYLFILTVAAFFPNTRGVHWGPRFIVCIIPLLLVYSMTRAQRWWIHYKAARPVVVVLLVISVLSQLYSFDTLLEARRFNTKLNRWVQSTGSEPAMTSLGWLPGDCALFSDRFPWFYTDRVDRLNVAIIGLRHRGVKRFNFFERPPYVDRGFWFRLGVEPLGEDYFLGGDGRLRRSWFRIIG